VQAGLDEQQGTEMWAGDRDKTAYVDQLKRAEVADEVRRCAHEDLRAYVKSQIDAGSAQ